MTAAFVLPKLLDRLADRTVMLSASAVLAAGLAAMAILTSMHVGRSYWPELLVSWAILGVAYSMTVTPSGRLLRRSSSAEDRPALFAAQFALSHVCWLICYPLVGQIGARQGMAQAFAVMAAIAAVGTTLGLALWPRRDAEVVAHEHPELAPGHPHLEQHRAGAHAFVIDELHPSWPRNQ